MTSSLGLLDNNQRVSMSLQALIFSSGTNRSRENSNMTGRKASSKFGGFTREHISFHFLNYPAHPVIVHDISLALSWGSDQVLFLVLLMV